MNILLEFMVLIACMKYLVITDMWALVVYMLFVLFKTTGFIFTMFLRWSLEQLRNEFNKISKDMN